MTQSRHERNDIPVDFGVEALHKEYLPDYVYHETASLRLETTDAVKRMAAHIISQLNHVPVRATRKIEATKRFMDKPARPAVTQKIYAEAVDYPRSEPVCAGVSSGASQPLMSLKNAGITARPVELTVDTGTGLAARFYGRHESHWSNIRDRDVAVRFYIPGEISADDLFKERYPRLAVSTTGQLNGMWNTVSWLDDKVQPVQALEHDGYKFQYAAAFIRGIGNACLVGEAAQQLYGGEYSRSDTVSVHTERFITELTDIADDWFTFAGRASERQDMDIQLYNELPAGNQSHFSK